MVQLEPNLTLTLKHLASCGAVLSAEQQAALDHSLPIKKVESGLKTLVLWGRITVLNGKDYLIAEGSSSAVLREGLVVYESKFFYSQDGARWNDLQPVDAETAKRCARIKGQLSGDAAKNYELEEADPNAGPVEEGEEPKPPLVFQVPELAALRCRVDAITTATGVIPASCMLVNSHNQVVVNRLFAGSPYPEKLEAYQHRSAPPGGATLAQDLRGTWAVHYDAFKGIAQCRSLLWPGYFFYYSANDLMWGSLYSGDGIRNNDLIFML